MSTNKISENDKCKSLMLVKKLENDIDVIEAEEFSIEDEHGYNLSMSVYYEILDTGVELKSCLITNNGGVFDLIQCLDKDYLDMLNEHILNDFNAKIRDEEETRASCMWEMMTYDL